MKVQKKGSDKIWSMEEELNEVVAYKNSLYIIRVFENNLLLDRSPNKLKTLISQHNYLDDLKETARLLKKIETGRL